MSTIQVQLYINGSSYLLYTLAARTLLDVLREDLGLTGAKDACGGEGECGACTVLLDGAPINSCMVLIGQADGHQVETIEGLSLNGEPHPVQKAFVEAGAVQCGYCTPGAVIAAKALLDRVAHPSNEQIREAMAGNLCRCTGYSKILDAVQMAAEEINHDR
jgi:aerobic-type carbon monoxide dehydrogenase small subunit (CoxS/CutS family)